MIKIATFVVVALLFGGAGALYYYGYTYWLWLGVSFFCGCSVTGGIALWILMSFTDDILKDAYKHNAGSFEIDPKTGNRVFVWIDSKTKGMHKALFQ